jgi:hypothetical protein
LRASIAKKLKIQLHKLLLRYPKEGLTIHDILLQIFQEDASKENPRDAWVIELDKVHLNLLYI